MIHAAKYYQHHNAAANFIIFNRSKEGQANLNGGRGRGGGGANAPLEINRPKGHNVQSINGEAIMRKE